MEREKWINSDNFAKRSLATFGYSIVGYMIVALAFGGVLLFFAILGLLL